MAHAPRSTGEVVVPLAVTLSTLACVNTPPRTSPRAAGRGGTHRPDAGHAVVRGQPVVEDRPVGVHELHHAQIALAAPRRKTAWSPRPSSIPAGRRTRGYSTASGSLSVDFPQLQPLPREVLGERRRLRAGQHPFDLHRQTSGLPSRRARPAPAAPRRAWCSTRSKTAATRARNRQWVRPDRRAAHRGTGNRPSRAPRVIPPAAPCRSPAPRRARVSSGRRSAAISAPVTGRRNARGSRRAMMTGASATVAVRRSSPSRARGGRPAGRRRAALRHRNPPAASPARRISAAVPMRTEPIPKGRRENPSPSRNQSSKTISVRSGRMSK